MKKAFGEKKGTTRKVNVYKTLKDAISFLELKPGSAINEADLVAELGVSRTPIREALIRLADEMLVDIYPQRGTYVSRIDLSLAKQMAYMRHVVETDICLGLCEKKADISDATAHSVFLMELALKKGDIVSYIQHDDDFHRALFSYAGHETVWNIISNTRTHYIRFLMLDLNLPNSLEESYQDHQKIVEYIGSGRKEELLDLLDVHHDYNNMKREAEIRTTYSEYFV